VEQELIHDLAAAYALNALDDSERSDFEEHLAGCEQCSEELEGLSDAAAALAYVPEGPAPPVALRERLLEQVHVERASNVVPLRRRVALPAVASFAVAAAAAAIVLAVWASGLSSSLDRKDAIARVLGDPTATNVSLGQSSRVSIGQDGRAVLVSRLSRAPLGKTYEVWVIPSGGSAKPAGLFEAGRAASPMLLARRVPSGAQLGISIERGGGASHPTDILFVSPRI
jgi:anti-sigma-K factor RskA